MAPARPSSAFPASRAPLSRPSSALSLSGVNKWPRSGRPTSAVPGWPGVAPPGGADGGQRLWRPGSAASTGRSKQPLFSPSFTEISSGSTRAMKDWQVAGDLAQRSQRHDTLQLRRQAASLGQLHEPSALVDFDTHALDFACPLARGPSGEKLRPEVRPKSANWHKKKVKQIYKFLDPQRDGAVRLEQLRESFQVMSVPLNDQTFAQYAQDLLPTNTMDPDSTVFTEDFINFHKQVWANQPAFVRWHAGDPGECETTKPHAIPVGANMAIGVSDAMMQRSGSAPSIVSMGELRNNEVMLRKSFTRHADGRSALLPSDKIPAILQDLGLPGDLQDILATIDMETSTIDVADELTFHQTVGIVNKCIATHEASRETASLSLAASKVGERLEAALNYSTALGQELSSEDELTLKEVAQAALEAALNADDDEDPITKARHALEAALFGDSEDEQDDLTTRAQRALEAALDGDDDEEEHEVALRNKARHSIEAALLGLGENALGEMGLGGLCDEENLKNKARRSIELALLGDISLLETTAEGDGDGDDSDDLGDDDDGDNEQREDALCRKARHSIEAALLGDMNLPGQGGGNNEEDEEEQALCRKARHSIEAALLGDMGLLGLATGDDHSDLTIKAQDALEAALASPEETPRSSAIAKAQSALEAALASGDEDE